MCKKILKTFWQEFLFGGHLQCLGVISIAYLSSLFFKIKIDFLFFLSIYLISYSTYLNDRLAALKIDEKTNPERSAYLGSHFWLFSKLRILSVFLIAILLFLTKNLKFLIFGFALLFLGWLYPIYFKNLSKKIPAFKNFYVGGFFSVIALAPTIYSSSQFSFLFPLILFVLFVFLKTFLMQVLLDLKDRQVDKVFGLKTIPSLLGKEKTLKFLKIANFFVTFSLIPICFAKIFPLKALLLLFSFSFNLFSYYLASKENYYAYLLESGEFFFWGVLIFIFETICRFSL